MSKQAISLLTLTLIATGVIAANRFTTVAGAHAGSGAIAVGCSRASAAIGDAVPVDVFGTVVVEAGGVITAGQEVQADSVGRAVASAGGVILGVALQAASGSGVFIEVMLQHQLGAKLGYVAAQGDVTAVSANGALPISGISLITGGGGLAGLTLAAPAPGCLARIRVVSTSGNVVITTAAGVTFDGTNNTATMNAAGDELILGYKSATEWYVVQNTSTTLSSV